MLLVKEPPSRLSVKISSLLCGLMTSKRASIEPSDSSLYHLRSAIANKSSVFVFNLTMGPFKSSSDKLAVLLTSNASAIAMTENLLVDSEVAPCLLLTVPSFARHPASFVKKKRAKCSSVLSFKRF